jgi:hypothetical protein
MDPLVRTLGTRTHVQFTWYVTLRTSRRSSDDLLGSFPLHPQPEAHLREDLVDIFGEGIHNYFMTMRYALVSGTFRVTLVASFTIVEDGTLLYSSGRVYWRARFLFWDSLLRFLLPPSSVASPGPKFGNHSVGGHFLHTLAVKLSVLRLISLFSFTRRSGSE